MEGSEKVIKELNRTLSAKLTAIVQYMVHAKMCEAWGYAKLAAATKKRAIDEMHHAEGLIERALFLEGKLVVEVPLSPKIGGDPKSQLDLDLRAEAHAAKQYNTAVAACVDEGDNGTRQLFLKMIHDEEHHADYLEMQLDLIGKLGIRNYLCEQMQGG